MVSQGSQRLLAMSENKNAKITVDIYKRSIELFGHRAHGVGTEVR